MIIQLLISIFIILGLTSGSLSSVACNKTNDFSTSQYQFIDYKPKSNGLDKGTISLDWKAFINEGKKILETSDHGLLILESSEEIDVKNSQENYFSSNLILRKINELRYLEWVKPIFIEGFDGLSFEDAITTDDHSFIILGNAINYISDYKYVLKKYFLLEINENLTIEWQFLLDESESFSAHDFIKTKDDGFVIVGYKKELDRDNVFSIQLVKYDENGTMLWNSSYLTDCDHTYMIQETNDNGFLIIGSDVLYSENDKDYSDIVMYKFDENGSFIWNKYLDFSDDDDPHVFIKTSEHSYIIAGTSITYTSEYKVEFEDIFLCIDDMGNIIWNKRYASESWKYFEDIERVDDGFIIAGCDLSDGLLFKIDNDGDVLWRSITKLAPTTLYDMVQLESGELIGIGSFKKSDIHDPIDLYSIYVGTFDSLGSLTMEKSYFTNAQFSIKEYDNQLIITNIGVVSCYNFSCEMKITGGYISDIDRVNKTSQDVFLPNTQETFLFPFGFGKIHLTLTITGMNLKTITFELDGFLFGRTLIKL